MKPLFYTESRPWGKFEVLTVERDHKVKRITVRPGKRLSLQRHKRRTEHWFFLSGEGKVTIGENEILVKKGISVDIARNELHRVNNTGEDDLVFIEVQIGEYFGEDDIERIDDDFGR